MRDINPDSEENTRATKDNQTYIGALKLQAQLEKRYVCPACGCSIISIEDKVTCCPHCDFSIP